MTPISIIIADDHPIVRMGLKEMLQRNNDVQVIGEATDGVQALGLIETLSPSIAMIDMDMPKMNGLDVIKNMRNKNLSTLVVMMTAYHDESIFFTAVDLGVCGFLEKGNGALEILCCIETVVNGGRYFSTAMTEALALRNETGSAGNKNSWLADLTVTEIKIIKLVAQNKTTNDISNDLFISQRTVENHRTNICKKFNITGSNALLRFALCNKDRI